MTPHLAHAETFGREGRPRLEHNHRNVIAENPRSGAYGIPRALSGSLMASSGLDWQTNAATQIR
jgi:hypothetical protein